MQPTLLHIDTGEAQNVSGYETMMKRVGFIDEYEQWIATRNIENQCGYSFCKDNPLIMEHVSRSATGDVDIGDVIDTFISSVI